MTNTLKLRIVTPESTFYEDDVDIWLRLREWTARWAFFLSTSE